MVRKKRFYTVAKGLKTDIFESWEACQKTTKGFKGAEFKSFPEKIEAETWLKEKWDANIDTDKEKPTELNEKPTELNEKPTELNEKPTELNEKPTELNEKPTELNEKHCSERCKYHGKDEEFGAMIECCFCKRWYHLECMGLDTKSKQDELNSEDKDDKGDKISSEETMILFEDEENAEAKTASNTGDAKTEKTDGKNKDKDDPTEDPEDSQFWFCNTCSEMPRQVSQMIKLLSDVQKNMKNMKKSLDDMKNKVSSVETVELQPELPERETPPVTKTRDCCTNQFQRQTP